MKITVLILLSILSSKVFAAEFSPSPYIEIYGGTGGGDYRISQVDYGSTSRQLGGRLGAVLVGGFVLGVEAAAVTGSVEMGGTKYDFSGKDAGGFALYQFDMGLRFYFSVFTDSEYRIGNHPTDNKLWKGGGTRVGFGYRFFPNVALNLEYSNRKYGEYNEINITVDDNKATTSHTMLFLSFPFMPK